MAKVFGCPVVLQFNVAVFEPLMVIGTVDPLLVSVAVPAETVQVLDRLPEGNQLPFPDSVAVEPLAVKTILPGTVIATPLQVTVKL